MDNTWSMNVDVSSPEAPVESQDLELEQEPNGSPDSAVVLDADVSSPEAETPVESQDLKMEQQPTEEHKKKSTENDTVNNDHSEEYSMLQETSLLVRGSQIAILVAEEVAEVQLQHRLNVLLINMDEGCANHKEKITEKVSRVMQLVKKRIAMKQGHPGRIEYLLYSPTIANKLLHSCQSCKCSFFLQEEMVCHFESLHPEQVHQCSVCDEKICGPVRMQEKHLELHRALEEDETDDLLSTLGVPSMSTNLFDPEFVVVPLGNCPLKFPMTSRSAENLQSKFLYVINRSLWIKPDMKNLISHSVKIFISKIQLCKRVRKAKPKVEHNVCTNILKFCLERQMKSNPIPEKIQCCHCDLSYMVCDENSHIEEYHNGGKNLVCKICDSKFNENGEIQPHMIPKSKLPFACSMKTCSKVYRTEANLEEHRQTAHFINLDTSPCLCELCGKVYNDKIGLQFHIQLVHLPKKTAYTCELCNVNFSRRSGLSRHKIAVHEPKVPCHVCGKLLTKPVLYKHLRIHDDASKFPCKYCGKLYTTPGSCRVHEKSRHEGVQIRCTICKDLWFKSVKGMEEHRLKHERGEEIILPRYLQPVQCSICSKTFPNSGRLKEHMKWHNKHETNERKMLNGRQSSFPCVPCLLRFTGKEVYDRHVEIHHPNGIPISTLKPKASKFHYQCRYCGTNFKKKTCCDDHESVHGSGKRHTCEICGKKFWYYADKWAHKQKCKLKCSVSQS